MIATTFDIFTGKPTMVESGTAPAPHQVKTPVINPCKGCEFYGLCDTDDCGQNMSLLDLVSTRFKNLGEYVTFMKKNGLL